MDPDYRDWYNVVNWPRSRFIDPDDGKLYYDKSKYALWYVLLWRGWWGTLAGIAGLIKLFAICMADLDLTPSNIAYWWKKEM